MRVALGARAGDVVAMVLAQSMKLTAIGAGIGLASALTLSRPLSMLLFEMSGRDAVTLAIVTTLLTSIALLASWVPARRASRIDPLVALRGE